MQAARSVVGWQNIFLSASSADPVKELWILLLLVQTNSQCVGTEIDFDLLYLHLFPRKNQFLSLFGVWYMEARMHNRGDFR